MMRSYSYINRQIKEDEIQKIQISNDQTKIPKINRNVVWIDQDINSKENKRFQIKLEHQFKKCFYYDSIKKYEANLDHPDLNSKDNYFVITSGSIGEQLIQKINMDVVVDGIFIYCFDQEKHRKWTEGKHKVKCVTNSMEEIISNLQKHVSFQSYDRLNYKQAFHFTGSEQFINYVDLEFIINLIRQFPLNIERALREFTEYSVKYITKHYINEGLLDQQLNILQSISKDLCNYRENDTTIIKWYTEDCFFYGMINNTIREGDILNIFFIRIGIYLLYSQLKNLSKQQNYKSITLYRGCVLNKKEFEVWETAKQPFIMQGFSSTSACKETAKKFMNETFNRLDYNQQADSYKIIIEIQYNKQASQDQMIYPIDISEFSFFQHEKEYLIQLNTSLKVEQINQEDYYKKIKTELKLFDINELRINESSLQRKIKIDTILQIQLLIEHFILAHYLLVIQNGKKIKELMDKLNDEILDDSDKCVQRHFNFISLFYIGEISEFDFIQKLSENIRYFVGENNDLIPFIQSFISIENHYDVFVFQSLIQIIIIYNFIIFIDFQGLRSLDNIRQFMKKQYF